MLDINYISFSFLLQFMIMMIISMKKNLTPRKYHLDKYLNLMQHLKMNFVIIAMSMNRNLNIYMVYFKFIYLTNQKIHIYS